MEQDNLVVTWTTWPRPVFGRTHKELIENDENKIQNILDKLRFRLFFDNFFEEARSELIVDSIKNRKISKIVVPTSETFDLKEKERDFKMPLSGKC